MKSDWKLLKLELISSEIEKFMASEEVSDLTKKRAEKVDAAIKAIPKETVVTQKPANDGRASTEILIEEMTITDRYAHTVQKALASVARPSRKR